MHQKLTSSTNNFKISFPTNIPRVKLATLSSRFIESPEIPTMRKSRVSFMLKEEACPRQERCFRAFSPFPRNFEERRYGWTTY